MEDQIDRVEFRKRSMTVVVSPSAKSVQSEKFDKKRFAMVVCLSLIPAITDIASDALNGTYMIFGTNYTKILDDVSYDGNCTVIEKRTIYQIETPYSGITNYSKDTHTQWKVSCFEKDPIWGSITILFMFFPAGWMFPRFHDLIQLVTGRTNKGTSLLYYLIFTPLKIFLIPFYPILLIMTIIFGSFIHTDKMKQWMLAATNAEGTWETVFQLILQLFIIFVKADRVPSNFQLAAIVSSLVIVSKSSIERFLTKVTQLEEIKEEKVTRNNIKTKLKLKLCPIIADKRIEKNQTEEYQLNTLKSNTPSEDAKEEEKDILDSLIKTKEWVEKRETLKRGAEKRNTLKRGPERRKSLEHFKSLDLLLVDTMDDIFQEVRKAILLDVDEEDLLKDKPLAEIINSIAKLLPLFLLIGGFRVACIVIITVMLKYYTPIYYGTYLFLSCLLFPKLYWRKHTISPFTTLNSHRRIWFYLTDFQTALAQTALANTILVSRHRLLTRKENKPVLLVHLLFNVAVNSITIMGFMIAMATGFGNLDHWDLALLQDLKLFYTVTGCIIGFGWLSVPLFYWQIYRDGAKY